MPNGFDFDFEEAYGKPFEKMSRKEKDMAIMSQLYYLRVCTKPMGWLTKMGWAVGAMIPWLSYLTYECYRHFRGLA